MSKYTVLSMQYWYCCDSAVGTVLLQQHCCNSTVATLLLQQYCSNSTVARALLQQHCCNSTLATVLLQQYCCNSTVSTALLQQCCCNSGRAYDRAKRLRSNMRFRAPPKSEKSVSHQPCPPNVPPPVSPHNLETCFSPAVPTPKLIRNCFSAISSGW